MSDLYSELLVKKKQTAKDLVVKYGLIALTVIMVLGGLVLNVLLLVPAIALGIACYFVIPKTVRESEIGTGFDALNEKYVNMVENGILDPAKVTRSALQNATSVASTLLTTESVVANIKEDAPAMPAGGAPGMGMM